MKSTAALALALGLAYATMPSTGAAAGLEQKGTPANVSALPNYGLEVPTRTALKTVIPPGWQLFVHQSAKLPRALSWQPGDAWPQVLAVMAATGDLAVLLDWDARTVLVRTEEVAVQEKATRAEIAQAAVTPLPKFETAAPKKDTAAPALEQVPASKSEQRLNVLAAGGAASALPQPEKSHDTLLADVSASTSRAALPTPTLDEKASVGAAASDGVSATSSVEVPKPAALSSLASAQTPHGQGTGSSASPAALGTPNRAAEVSEAVLQIGAPAPVPSRTPLASHPVPAGAPMGGSESGTSAPAKPRVVAAVPAEAPRTPSNVNSVRAPSAPRVPARMPVIRTNPTPEMVASQEMAAAKRPAGLSSTDKFSYVSPTALNKPDVRMVAQAIAARYGLRLVWAAPEVSLRGPVTLLSNSAEQDLALLKKALGPSELRMDIDAQSKTLLAYRHGEIRPASAAGAAQAQPTGRTAALAVAATPEKSPVTAGAVGSVASSVMPDAMSAPVTPAVAPAFLLMVAQSEPLENALLRFLRAHGYTYEWKVSGGFEANRAMAFEGASLVQVLSQVLPPLGVSADVYTHDKHVVIRPGEALDK